MFSIRKDTLKEYINLILISLQWENQLTTPVL